MLLRSNDFEWFVVSEYCKYHIAYLMWNSAHCYELWFWVTLLEIVFAKNWIFSFCIVVPITIVIALLLAVALNGKLKGKGVYRTIYFIPMVAAPAAVTMYGNGCITISMDWSIISWINLVYQVWTGSIIRKWRWFPFPWSVSGVRSDIVWYFYLPDFRKSQEITTRRLILMVLVRSASFSVSRCR